MMGFGFGQRGSEEAKRSDGRVELGCLHGANICYHYYYSRLRITVVRGSSSPSTAILSHHIRAPKVLPSAPRSLSIIKSALHAPLFLFSADSDAWVLPNPGCVTGRILASVRRNPSILGAAQLTPASASHQLASKGGDVAIG